jgi:hypothetical protein
MFCSLMEQLLLLALFHWNKSQKSAHSAGKVLKLTKQVFTYIVDRYLAIFLNNVS